MDRKSKLALQEEIIQAGEPAFDPALPEDERKRGFDGFETFLDRLESSGNFYDLN